jgi:hypothetical protein
MVRKYCRVRSGRILLYSENFRQARKSLDMGRTDTILSSVAPKIPKMRQALSNVAALAVTRNQRETRGQPTYTAPPGPRRQDGHFESTGVCPCPHQEKQHNSNLKL